MKRIVILKVYLIDAMEEFVLTECLGIMFPECDIEIRAVTDATGPDVDIYRKPD